MATIKRARSYFLYVIAISVSAVLGLFGKSAPGWAQDKSAAQSARVFQQQFKGTQISTPQSKTGAWLTAELNPYQEVAPGFMGALSPAAQSAYQMKINEVLKQVEDTAKNNQPLTDQQVIFLKQVQNDSLINSLNQKISDLSVQVDTLLKMMKEDNR